MRRTTLIFGLILTLTAGVWGGALAAVAAACCADEMSAPDVAAAPAPDEHDCCRAKLGEPDAPHAETTEHAHAATATHEDEPSHEPQAGGPHAGMDCAGAGEPEDEVTAAAFGGRSCVECCAGRGNRTPTTATVSAPEPNKVKRAAPYVSASAHDSFTTAAQGVSPLTPTQHAPPASRERRHILISVFLI
ncbi:MAG TPA: hypothetical protein VF634_06940 [Pyrinomonadaceae bacterium]